jgi:hypothetical protein
VHGLLPMYFDKLYVKSHDLAPSIFFLIFLVLLFAVPGVPRILLVLILFLGVSCAFGLILVAENDIIALFVLPKLVLDLLDLLLFIELRAFLQFISDKKRTEGIGFLPLEVLVDVLHLLIGGDTQLHLHELS